MNTHVQAAESISSLFADHGATILAEAGLSSSWEQVLAAMPAEVTTLPEDGEGTPGLLLLAKVRDHWIASKQLRPAIAATRALLRVQVAVNGHDHADTLVELGCMGDLASRTGRPDEATDMLTQSLQGLRSALGDRDLRVADAWQQNGLHHIRRGDLRNAEVGFSQAYRIRKSLAPESTAVVAAQLGEVKLHQGMAAEAADLLQESWLRHKEEFGPSHQRTMNRAQTLAVVLKRMQDWEKAVPVLRDLVQDARKRRDNQAKHEFGFDLGVALDATGHKEEAYRLIRDGLQWLRQAHYEEEQPSLPERLDVWVRICMDRGQADEAEAAMTEAMDIERDLYGDNSEVVGLRYAELGRFYLTIGRIQEAIGCMDVSASLLRSNQGDQDPQTRRVVETLVELMLKDIRSAQAQRENQLAKDLHQRATALGEPVLGRRHRLCRELRGIKLR